MVKRPSELYRNVAIEFAVAVKRQMQLVPALDAVNVAILFHGGVAELARTIRRAALAAQLVRVFGNLRTPALAIVETGFHRSAPSLAALDAHPISTARQLVSPNAAIGFVNLTISFASGLLQATRRPMVASNSP